MLSNMQNMFNMFGNMSNNPLTNWGGSSFCIPPQQPQSPLGMSSLFSVMSFMSMLLQLLEKFENNRNGEGLPQEPICGKPPQTPPGNGTGGVNPTPTETPIKYEGQPGEQQIPLEAAVGFFKYNGNQVYQKSPDGPNTLTRAYLERVARGEVPGIELMARQATQVILLSADWTKIETAEKGGAADGVVTHKDFDAYRI